MNKTKYSSSYLINLQKETQKLLKKLDEVTVTPPFSETDSSLSDNETSDSDKSSLGNVSSDSSPSSLKSSSSNVSSLLKFDDKSESLKKTKEKKKTKKSSQTQRESEKKENSNKLSRDPSKSKEDLLDTLKKQKKIVIFLVCKFFLI